MNVIEKLTEMAQFLDSTDSEELLVYLAIQTEWVIEQLNSRDMAQKATPSDSKRVIRVLSTSKRVKP